MESKKGVSKGVIFSAIIIFIIVGVLIGGAFYIDSKEPKIVEEKDLNGGRVLLTYSDEVNLFSIENAIPTSDQVGTVSDSAELFFDFTVKTEIDEANYVEYEVVLIKDETVSTALDNNIKVYLEKENSGTYSKVVSPTVFTSDVSDENLGNSVMSLYKYKKETSGNDNYRLRMWLSDTAVFNTNEAQNFGVKVAVRGVAK